MAPKRQAGKFSEKNGSKPKNAKISFNLKGKFEDEEIASDDEEIDSDDIASSDESSEEEQETAEEKRKRLAKEYLQSMKDDEIESSDDNNSDNGMDDPISLKLRKGRLEAQGKYFRNCAESASLIDVNELPSRHLSGHDVCLLMFVYYLFLFHFYSYR